MTRYDTVREVEQIHKMVERMCLKRTEVDDFSIAIDDQFECKDDIVDETLRQSIDGWATSMNAMFLSSCTR